jgi:hypothetical protein
MVRLSGSKNKKNGPRSERRWKRSWVRRNNKDFSWKNKDFRLINKERSGNNKDWSWERS